MVSFIDKSKTPKLISPKWISMNLCSKELPSLLSHPTKIPPRTHPRRRQHRSQQRQREAYKGVAERDFGVFEDAVHLRIEQPDIEGGEAAPDD